MLVRVIEPARTSRQVAGREQWIIELSSVTLIGRWVCPGISSETLTWSSGISSSIALTGWDSARIWSPSSVALCRRSTSITCWSSCRIALSRGSSSISSSLWVSQAWLRLGRVS